MRHLLSPISILAIFLLLNLHIEAQAARLEKGIRAYQRGEFTNAYQMLEPLAKEGDPQAQTMLGWMHEWGQSVHQSFITAEWWYVRASLQGYDLAAQKRAQMHERMETMFQEGMTAFHRGDYVTARGFWSKLANQNHPAAQTNMGALYYEGLGVKRDWREARRWWSKAANLGYAEAQKNLARMDEKIAQRGATRQEALKRRQEGVGQFNKVLVPILVGAAAVLLIGGGIAMAKNSKLKTGGKDTTARLQEKRKGSVGGKGKGKAVSKGLSAAESLYEVFQWINILQGN